MARRTVKEVLTAAALPAPLEAKVRETVRRTRLRRGERAEIARELAAHMQAGLDAGASVSEQAEAFGDPRVVARPLRRAARRRRPLLDRVAVNAAKLAGVAVILYTAAAVRIATLRPTPDFDGIERLQSMMPAVTADAAAWPVYREALAWNRRERVDGGPITGEATFGGTTDPGSDATPDPAALAVDHAALRRRGPELAALRRAASMPALGWRVDVSLDEADRAYFGEEQQQAGPGTNGRLVLGVQLPFYGELRSAARLLAAEARLAAASPDSFPDAGQVITDNLVAMLGIARHAGEPPVLISQLVQVAIIAMSSDEAVRVLEADASLLTDAQLDRIAAAFAGIDPVTWTPRIEGERLMLEDVVQHLYSTDADGDGVLLLGAFESLRSTLQPGDAVGSSPLAARPSLVATLGGPLAATLIAGPRETMHEADRLYGLLLQEASRPLLEQTGAYDAEVSRLAATTAGRIRQPLLALLMPAIGRVGEHLVIVRMAADRVPLAVALERHRRATGRFPATLEDLRRGPVAFDRIPADAWSGRPLKYGLADGRLRLWSVGPDGRDDGGLLGIDPATGEPERSPRPRSAARPEGTPADAVLLDLPATGPATGPEPAAQNPEVSAG